MPTRQQQLPTARVAPHGTSDPLPAPSHSRTAYGGSGPGSTSLVDGAYAAAQRRPMEDWGAIGATIGSAVGEAAGDYGGGLYDQYLDPPDDDFYDTYIDLVTPPDKPPASKDFTEISGTDKPPANKDFTEISGTDKPPGDKDLSQLVLSPEQLAIKKQEADKLWLNANPGADPVTGLSPKEKWLAANPGADPVTGLTPQQTWLALNPGADPITGLTPEQTTQLLAEAQALYLATNPGADLRTGLTPSPIFDPTNPLSFTATDTPLVSVTPVTPPFPTDPNPNALAFGQTPFPTTGGQLIASIATDPILAGEVTDDRFADATVAPGANPIPLPLDLWNLVSPEYQAQILQHGLDFGAAVYLDNARAEQVDETTPSWVLQGVQGRLGVPPTGVLDEATIAAVVQLQTSLGLQQTGVIDTPVLGRLKYLAAGAGSLGLIGDADSVFPGNPYLPASTDLTKEHPHHPSTDQNQRFPVYDSNGNVTSDNWPSNLAVPTVTIDGKDVPYTDGLGLPAANTDIAATDFSVGTSDQSKDLGQPLVAPDLMKVIEIDPAEGLVVLENLTPTEVPLAGGGTAVLHERIVILHAYQILVQPGETVVTGQMIATQGKTNTPQLHNHIAGSNQMRLDFINAQTHLAELHESRMQPAPGVAAPTEEPAPATAPAPVPPDRYLEPVDSFAPGGPTLTPYWPGGPRLYP